MRAISPARRASSSAAARSAAGVAPSGEVKEVDPAGSARMAPQGVGRGVAPGGPGARAVLLDAPFVATNGSFPEGASAAARGSSSTGSP